MPVNTDIRQPKRECGHKKPEHARKNVEILNDNDPDTKCCNRHGQVNNTAEYCHRPAFGKTGFHLFRFVAQNWSTPSKGQDISVLLEINRVKTRQSKGLRSYTKGGA